MDKLHPFTHVVEIDGVQFEYVKPNSREYAIAVSDGLLPVLSVDSTGDEPDVIPTDEDRLAAMAEDAKRMNAMLCRYVLRPKLHAGADAAPDGSIPVEHLPDSVYSALIAAISATAGMSTEAADEIRPTSATSPVS